LNTKRIVITGGPGTGKTSIINDLKKNDFYCFDEIIRALTLAATKDRNPSEHISNPIDFVDDPKQFNTNLINGRVSHFKDAKTLTQEICFFDRGIPDVLAYMEFFNQSYDTFFTDACSKHTYDHVFLLPPWKAIYKSDNERFESFEQAQQIHEHLVKVYKTFGYTIIEVPFGTIEERSAFILNNIPK